MKKLVLLIGVRACIVIVYVHMWIRTSQASVPRPENDFFCFGNFKTFFGSSWRISKWKVVGSYGKFRIFLENVALIWEILEKFPELFNWKSSGKFEDSWKLSNFLLKFLKFPILNWKIWRFFENSGSFSNFQKFSFEWCSLNCMPWLMLTIKFWLSPRFYSLFNIIRMGKIYSIQALGGVPIPTL